MKLKAVAAALAAAALTVGLAACSPGGSTTQGADALKPGPNGSAKASDCTNKIVHASAPLVTVWAWYPNMAKVVDDFNNAHTDVQACWRNAGQGLDEYNKFQTAIAAKKGAPDVVMLEADHLATYEIQNALVDISGLGWDKVKGNFSTGAIKDVSAGSAVYAAPVDGGPMALIYRKDIFQKYGITTPPATWDEYAADAAKVKAAGGPAFGDLGSNVPAVMMALEIQKGAQPFKYDYSSAKSNVTVDLADQPSKDVLDYWSNLSKKGLVGKQDQFTTDYISGVVGGKYATYVSAAWAPGYLAGAGVGKGSDKGKFGVAPLPQWNSSSPVSVNWGGSAFAVTSQATDKKLSAKVALGLYADSSSLADGWQNQIIFPLNQSVLKSSEFTDAKVGFFNGQTANKDIYIPAENAYKGFVYPPFVTYYYAQLQKEIASINNSGTSGSAAATTLQQSVTKYATSQGFKVAQ